MMLPTKPFHAGSAGLFWQENAKRSRRPLLLTRGNGGFWGRYRPTVVLDDVAGGRGEPSSGAGRTGCSWNADSCSEGRSGSRSGSIGSSVGSGGSGSSGRRDERGGSGSETSGGENGMTSGVGQKRGGGAWGAGSGTPNCTGKGLMLANNMPHEFKAKRHLRRDNMEHVCKLTGAPEDTYEDRRPRGHLSRASSQWRTRTPTPWIGTMACRVFWR